MLIDIEIFFKEASNQFHFTRVALYLFLRAWIYSAIKFQNSKQKLSFGDSCRVIRPYKEQ